MLTAAIKSGMKFYKSLVLEDPIKISLYQSKQCTELILKYFSKHIVPNNPKVFIYIEPLLKQFNSGDFINLPYIYESAFTACRDKNLQNFGVLISGNGMMVRRNSSEFINQQDFLYESMVSGNWTQEPILFSKSYMRLPMYPGSLGSVLFLQSLVMCKNPAIFKTDIIKSLLNYK